MLHIVDYLDEDNESDKEFQWLMGVLGIVQLSATDKLNDKHDDLTNIIMDDSLEITKENKEQVKIEVINKIIRQTEEIEKIYKEALDNIVAFNKQANIFLSNNKQK